MNRPPGPGLIVDVGMHDGSDTAFYLAKGFDVLAIEANPDLVAAAHEQFAAELAAGRLTLLPVAVTDYEGETEFFISDEDTWSSTESDMGDRGFSGVGVRRITVPCDTLDRLLADRPTPHYVKIDIEGRDADCVRAIRALPAQPRFVSFETPPDDPAEVDELVHVLEACGYDRFKLVNQALVETVRLPDPALEGDYVDFRFRKHMSGPFGAESPGPWLAPDEVIARYRDLVRQQALRIAYTKSGRLWGVPITRIHRQLVWLYNTRPVARFRERYARARGAEVGGWFDIHAAHADARI